MINMAEKSISKMQKQIDRLYKNKLKLQELLQERREKYNKLQAQYRHLESTIENKIRTSILKFKDTLIKENEELKNEIVKLKNLLHNSSEHRFPTTKTPVNKNKRIPNTREKTDKLKGGQLGHKKHKLEKMKDEEITDTRIHQVVRCNCGCENLIDLGIEKTKDEIDIDIRVQKIRNEFHKYQCPICKREIVTPIPNYLKEDNQYGSNVKAIAISLVNEGFISFNRTKKLINGFSSGAINMSEGFIVKLQKVCYEKLNDFNHELKLKLLKEKIIHWDDTVIMINKKRSCLRFYGNDQLAFFTAHETKGTIGLKEDAILSSLGKKTVVVHDHLLHNYHKDYEFQDAECCRHLLGDLKELNNDYPRDWLLNLSKLLVETNEERNKYIREDIDYFENVYIDSIIEKYDKILIEAKEINKIDFNKYYGQKEKALINRLIKYKPNYLMWILRFDIPFTNNVAERGLRGSKTKMKISGQFSNIANARYFASIRSYIETCKKNGLNPHIAIVKLLEGKPYTLNEILANKKD